MLFDVTSRQRRARRPRSAGTELQWRHDGNSPGNPTLEEYNPPPPKRRARGPRAARQVRHLLPDGGIPSGGGSPGQQRQADGAVGRHPTALHPTPYTLHPTPYTLHYILFKHQPLSTHPELANLLTRSVLIPLITIMKYELRIYSVLI